MNLLLMIIPMMHKKLCLSIRVETLTIKLEMVWCRYYRDAKIRLEMVMFR